MPRLRFVAPFAAVVALSFGGILPASATQWDIYKHYSFSKVQLEHPQPFAKEHIVMQVSQGDPARWNLLLNNVVNLTNYFGPDKAQVVVVAYGPGLKMLLGKSPMAKRVQSLSDQGVEFDACHNTMEGMKRKTGHLPQLVKSAVVVPGGIVRIVQLKQHGYTYIKP